MTIREFDGSDRDYRIRCDVGNAVFPDYAETVDELRHEDATRDPKIRTRRWIAEVDGAPVGTGLYTQSVETYHPRRFEVDAVVLEPFRGRGIGRALYDTAVAALAPLDPIGLRAHCREDFPRSVRFLADRGFTEAMRDWESRLDPRAFDPSPFQPKVDAVRAQGIVIRSVADLADDPDRDRKLYDLDWAVTQDMPSADPLTPPSFEHFLTSTLGGPTCFPEAWFVALDGDRYVGESSLWKSGADDSLYVGATGVLRDYRRRGIATALKIAAVERARAIGAPCIKTWNAQENRAMLSINEAMGFAKMPAWIQWEKTLKAENE